MKTCTKCTTDKPLTEFYKKGNGTGQYKPSCKACEKAANIARYYRKKASNNAKPKKDVLVDVLLFNPIMHRFAF